MPENGNVRLKAQLASEVAHIRRVRPEIRIGAVADGAADNWTFLESLSPETEVVDFWHAYEHLRVASDHAVAPTGSRSTARACATTPRPRRRQGDPGVVLPPRQCKGGSRRDRARAGLLPKAPPSHALPRPEGRRHRHRLGRVVEAACKTLVVQRLKRPGMSPTAVRRPPAARREIEGCQRESIIAVPYGHSVHGCRN